MKNISRTEFNHLGYSYFAIAGKNNWSFKNGGYNLTWNCHLCNNGCLQMTMNRNPLMDPSRYQSYGTITIATPCLDDCPSHAPSSTKKTIWLPTSHSREDMAITSNEIVEKKERHGEWVRSPCNCTGTTEKTRNPKETVEIGTHDGDRNQTKNRREECKDSQEQQE